LRDLLRENKIGTRQAAFALPGHAVFVRRVRLPRTSEERLQRIIRFEARQQIPFPLEQTLLQYQVTSTEVPDEVEVLLVAIKRDIVDNYMHLIRRLGLRPIRLGVSSFALFNFHMFDAGIKPEVFTLDELPAAKVEPVPVEKPEAKPAAEKPAKAGFLKSFLGGKKKKPPQKAAPAKAPAPEESTGRELVPVGPPEEVKAFVNIGASTMDLAIGRTGGSRVLGFARSIPVAGNQLTRIIQERCGIESFAEAERIKREQTQVTLGGAPPPADRYNEQACRAAMPVVDRMVSEIRRSLDFYISQPDGMAVDRLVISGGQVGLPNLASYVEERLGITVEIAREIHNGSCRSNVGPGVETTNFLVSIGLALHALGEGCITVDFLPEQMKGWIEFKRKNIQLAVQAGVLAGMLFVASQLGTRMEGLWRDKAREMQLTADGTARLKDELDKAEGHFQRVNLMILLIDRASGAPKSFGLDRDYFFKVLSLIQSVRPADVFFGDINMGPNGELTVDGYAEQQKSAALMTQAISQLPDIEKAALTRLPTQVRDPSGAGRGMIYSFQLTAQIKGKRSKIVPSLMPEPWRMGPGWGGGTPGAPGGPGPGGGARDSNMQS
jgi:Tfp pilus assembly PilM family ATPase